ncbi:MAG: RNA polymerase sigma factor [Minisyncoccia bacterium]
MTFNESDEEIIASYVAGEQEKFKELIERYAPILYNFVARMTNKSDASDILQEVFIKTWKNIKTFDSSKASFKTWIFSIAKNATTDFLRKRKTPVFSGMAKDTGKEENYFAENISDEDLLPDEALGRLEDEKHLNLLLSRLNPNYLEVLLLHYQEEMTFEEIGKILGKSLNTVKSQHRRALLELRKMLRP